MLYEFLLCILVVIIVLSVVVITCLCLPYRPNIRILRLNNNATMPRYQTKGSVGFDIHAFLATKVIEITPNVIYKIPTKLSFKIPHGYEVQIRSRSGLTLRHGIVVANSPGTVDSDYTGEIHVLLQNITNKPWLLHHNDRIAQCVIHKVEYVSILEHSKTSRGKNGFGFAIGFALLNLLAIFLLFFKLTGLSPL